MCLGFTLTAFHYWALPQPKSKWNKHFFEMKGDVGMSGHEKEGEQENAYTQEVIVNPIPTFFFVGMGLSTTSCLGIRIFLFS